MAFESFQAICAGEQKGLSDGVPLFFMLGKTIISLPGEEGWEGMREPCL